MRTCLLSHKHHLVVTSCEKSQRKSVWGLFWKGLILLTRLLSPWPAGLPMAPLPHPTLGVRISVHSFRGHKHSDHCTFHPDVQEEISASLPHHLPYSILSLMCYISQFYHFWQKWLTKTTSGSGLFTYLIAVTKAPSGGWPWLTVQGSVYHSVHWLFNRSICPLIRSTRDSDIVQFVCLITFCLFF